MKAASSQKPGMHELLPILPIATLATLLVVCSATAASQTSNYPDAPSPSQSIPQMSGPSSISAGQNPFTGSVPQGTVGPESMPLSFLQAINLGLRNNLGLLLQSNATLTARA